MPRKSMDGQRVHLILTRPQHRKLQQMSRKTGLPISEILRRAVDLYLTQ